MIRPKVRESQADWFIERTEAGCRTNWILIQVGEAHEARLYLVPGNQYGEIVATEAELELMSVCDPTISPVDVLLRASRGW